MILIGYAICHLQYVPLMSFSKKKDHHHTDQCDDSLKGMDYSFSH
jgi:hypothetical protein